MKKLIYPLLLSIFIVSIVTNATEDYFIGQLVSPQLASLEFDINISGYKPDVTQDGKFIVEFIFHSQTGSSPPNIQPESYRDLFFYDHYQYEATFLERVRSWIRWAYLNEPTIDYPLTPPFIISKIIVDCEKDGTPEYNSDYYKIAGASPTELQDTLRTNYVYDPNEEINAIDYKVPYYFQIPNVKCIFNYDETAKYKFTTNMSIRYFIEPNYWGLGLYDEDTWSNYYPGNFLTTSVKGESGDPIELSGCGKAGTIVNNKFKPSSTDSGCMIPLLLEYDTNGLKPPVIDFDFCVDNCTGGLPANSGQAESLTNDTVLPGTCTNEACCHEKYETGDSDQKGKLHQCLMLVAQHDMINSNKLNNFGIDIVRMIFSFVLLMFYIISLTIIGILFTIIIPGIFGKIQLLFSRATRLR